MQANQKDLTFTKSQIKDISLVISFCESHDPQQLFKSKYNLSSLNKRKA